MTTDERCEIGLGNQELKLKWHSLYGQLLRDRALMAAWHKVRENRGAGGVDGETIDSYGQDVEKNIQALLQKLKAKEYQPSPVRRVYIPKKDGKMRPLGIPTLEDRIVQQTLAEILQPKFEAGIFHRWSCGYRPGLGATRAVQLILWNVETGYNHIYDCDIRGFFDNIPHKKLMRVLNKYIADGTVLDMIWKWLKAGYMEEGKYFDVESGTPQGGVISPLLANIYLNELDWKLEEHGIRFVRYADDFLLFAKTEEDIQRAAQVAEETLRELGLEVSMEKTRLVDFNKDDFDFLGFTFGHWRKRKKDGKPYFLAQPKEGTWKNFRQKIKAKTKKTWTLGPKEWLELVNPVIRGKANYFLILYKAVQENAKYGQQSRCYFNIFGKQLLAIDGYIRHRLRVAMIHSHPSQRKGHLMKTRWNNEFFARIGLIPAYWWYNSKQFGYTIDQYIDYMKKRQKQRQNRAVERAKERGQEYYTPDRVRKMQCAQKG